MKNWLQAMGLLAILTLSATPLSAQWPDYPTRNVPRTPDGEPDLNGPVPRTSWGTVDLSGIWARQSGGGNDEEDANAIPQATFFDIGANLEGGTPYTPWAEELRAERMANDMRDNPDAHCLPIGHMQLHLHPQPRRMVQTEDLLVIIYESNYGLREIFLDGRPAPDNNPIPWWYGYSRGWWEGDTLVVETTHFRDGGWLDVNGSPLTGEGTITERFTRTEFGHLEIVVTVDDPKAYTEPFTVQVDQEIMVDTALIEFICNENERSTEYFDQD